jgi:hypothetical protein
MENCLYTFEAFRARDKAANAVEFAKHNPDILNYCFAVEEMIANG